MNERVRELVKQAYITDASKYPNWQFKPETEHLLKQIEGFTDELVRLIVSECVEVAMRSVSDDEPKEAWCLIEEHFGVSIKQPGEQ